MGDVLAFQRPRKKTLRGHARDCLTDAMRAHRRPVAVLVVVLTADGKYAMRTASDQRSIQDFDMYSRAGAVFEKERMRLVDGPDDGAA